MNHRPLMMPLTAKILSIEDVVWKIDAWGQQGGRRIYASVKGLSAVSVTKFATADQWKDGKWQLQAQILSEVQRKLEHYITLVEKVLL